MSNIIYAPQNRAFVTEIRIRNGEAFYRLALTEKLVFDLKKSPYNTDYIISKQLDAENTAQDGKGYVLKLSTQETNLPQGRYYYDVALKRADGELEPIIACADFIITNSVARSDASC